MDDFKSLKELYLKLNFAFNVKIRLLKKTKYNFLTKKELWIYLQNNKWKNDVGLTIAMMISDIINVDAKLVSKYMEEENEK